MAFAFSSSKWFNTTLAGGARAESHVAMDRVRSAETELETTQQQLDRLYLIVEAMWSMMKERLGLDDEHLGQLVESIDLRDGVRDGRAKRTAPKCAACQRAVSIRTGVCLYCGAMNERPLFP
jgi:hypothetical protein